MQHMHVVDIGPYATVIQSVHLSDTLVICVQTAKLIIKLFSCLAAQLW